MSLCTCVPEVTVRLLCLSIDVYVRELIVQLSWIFFEKVANIQNQNLKHMLALQAKLAPQFKSFYKTEKV